MGYFATLIRKIALLGIPALENRAAIPVNFHAGTNDPIALFLKYRIFVIHPICGMNYLPYHLCPFVKFVD